MGCKHDKMISPPTHRRASTGKGCRRSLSPAGHPARYRRRTVPCLRCVAVSSRMNPYRPQPGQYQPSLPSRRGRGTGPADARVTISPQQDAERARPFAHPADWPTAPRRSAAYHGEISVAADNPVTCGARVAQGISGAGDLACRGILINPYMERIWRIRRYGRRPGSTVMHRRWIACSADIDQSPLGTSARPSASASAPATVPAASPGQPQGGGQPQRSGLAHHRPTASPSG